jgi:hypothetical protein
MRAAREGKWYGGNSMKKRVERFILAFIAVAVATVALSSCSPLPMAEALRDLSKPVQVWKYPQKLTATTDLVAGATFGYAVSISGDYAIVGARGESTNTGAAYIFKRSSTTWTKLKRITPAVPVAGSRFGTAVGIDGSYAIVGGYAASNNSAYIFSKDQGGTDNWGQTQVLTGAASSNFGYAVAIKGLHAIVGAFGDASGKGAAYIYFRDQGGSNNWGLVSTVLDSAGVAGDNLGYSVAISDNYAVAGAPNSTNGLSVVYQKITDTNWGNAQRLTASDGTGGDQFGGSVSITDTDFIAGAPDKQYGYVFARTGSSWSEVAKLFSTSSQVSDQFGSAVSIYGNYLSIGAQGQDSNQGAAHVYDKTSGSWTSCLNSPLHEQTRAANDYFGRQSSIYGSYMLVGAFGDSSAASNAGAAYIYMLGDY